MPHLNPTPPTWLRNLIRLLHDLVMMRRRFHLVALKVFLPDRLLRVGNLVKKVMLFRNLLLLRNGLLDRGVDFQATSSV